MENSSDLPLVSIITLTYNKFESLEKTIKSVFNQEYRNIEYIICDDGSENFPSNIIEEYHKSGKKIDVIRHSNVGTVKNFNIAIQRSKGKYIIPLSGNDYFASSDIVTSIVDKFEKNDSDIITAKRACVDDNDEVIRVLPVEKKTELLESGDKDKIFIELCISSFISGASTYYSRRVLEKYNGFNENYTLIEDFPFYARFLLDGGRIDFINLISIKYDMHGVTSEKTPSLLITRDRRKYYKEFVWPNIKKMSHMQKQELKFRYFKICGNKNKIRRMLQYISCIDFISLKVVYKIMKMKGKICK